MIKCIIFDLDDTLCDYEKAKREAIKEVNKILSKTYINIEEFWEQYNIIEPKLFQEFLDNNITKEQYRIRRYNDILEQLITTSYEMSIKLNEVYMSNANNKIELFSDVDETLHSIKQKNIMMVILTNGPSDGQKAKYDQLNLNKYISKLYIGEEIGASKPHPLSFNFVLNDLGLKANEVLMVGDSVIADYQGAMNASINAILIDRENNQSTFEGVKIASLTELLLMLN